MTDKNPEAPRGRLEGSGWPSVRYSRAGERQAFNCAAEVPEGWEDTPDKFKVLITPEPSKVTSAEGAALANASGAARKQVGRPRKLASVKTGPKPIFNAYEFEDREE